MIDHYDYYVSGIKINTQVPRFEATFIDAKTPVTQTLDRILNDYEGCFIAFYPSEFAPDLKPFLDRFNTLAQAFPTLYCVAIGPNPPPVLEAYLATQEPFAALHFVANANRQIGEAYGILNEALGQFEPALFYVRKSGLLKQFSQASQLSELNPEAFLTPVTL